MLFGDQNEFAIEAEFDTWHGKWCFGRLRVWLKGDEHGDFLDSVDLASASRWGRTFLQHSEGRKVSGLSSLNASDLYNKVAGRPLREGGRRVGDTIDRDAFLFDDIGESSLRDRVSIVVARDLVSGRDRVVMKDLESGEFRDVCLERNSCDEIVDLFCTWCESLERQRDETATARFKD